MTWTGGVCVVLFSLGPSDRDGPVISSARPLGCVTRCQSRSSLVGYKASLSFCSIGTAALQPALKRLRDSWEAWASWLRQQLRLQQPCCGATRIGPARAGGAAGKMMTLKGEIVLRRLGKKEW